MHIYIYIHVTCICFFFERVSSPWVSSSYMLRLNKRGHFHSGMGAGHISHQVIFLRPHQVTSPRGSYTPTACSSRTCYVINTYTCPFFKKGVLQLLYVDDYTSTHSDHPFELTTRLQWLHPVRIANLCEALGKSPRNSGVQLLHIRGVDSIFRASLYHNGKNEKLLHVCCSLHPYRYNSVVFSLSGRSPQKLCTHPPPPL